MEKQFNNLPRGAKILSASEVSDTDLGALKSLQGEWHSKKGSGTGWNVIAVPGPGRGGFILEVIPYYEELKFTPAVMAGNRGPFIDGEESVQQVTGLIYEQRVFSDCDTEFCNERGFGKGVELHAETGMLLNITNFNEDNTLNIGRLGTIPHGNSILLLGKSSQTQNTGDFKIPASSVMPSGVEGSLPFGYSEGQYNNDHVGFADFDIRNPNGSLQKAIDGKKITDLITLDLSSKNGTGGILNIPFIQDHIDANKMVCTYWIQTLEDGSKQLQYSQDINLVFPATETTAQVNWPHVGLNTLEFIGKA
ncbi:MAG: heme-binding protein [Cyclobacteriaceae bacterium]